MNDDFFFVEVFDPQTTSDELFEKYFQYKEKQFRKTDPHDPVPNYDADRLGLLNPLDTETAKHWLAIHRKTGVVIGNLSLYWVAPLAPDYEANKHTAWFKLAVDHDFQRQGVGSKLMQDLVNELAGKQKSVIQIGSFEQSAKDAMEHLGIGVVALTEVENRLYTKDVDWSMIDKWITSAEKINSDVQLESFEVLPEKDLEEFSKFFTEVLNQVPKGESEWEAVLTPQTRRSYEKMNKLKKQLWITMVTREANNKFSGITDIFYDEKNPHRVGQGLTAVKIEYRGRGLGKWLKAKMLLYIKENFPKTQFIETGNANVNAPMLGINTKLGFKQHKTWIEYKFTYDELKNKFGS